jgi:hypothetical protein
MTYPPTTDSNSYPSFFSSFFLKVCDWENHSNIVCDWENHSNVVKVNNTLFEMKRIKYSLSTHSCFSPECVHGDTITQCFRLFLLSYLVWLMFCMVGSKERSLSFEMNTIQVHVFLERTLKWGQIQKHAWWIHCFYSESMPSTSWVLGKKKSLIRNLLSAD